MSVVPDSVTPETTPPRSRRAILAGALGGLAGLVAGRLGTPGGTKAAAGDPVIMGAANNAGASNTIVSTTSASTAFQVNQNGTGTALRGQTSAGIGVFGTSASGKGVSGTVTDSNSYGLYGEHAGAAGAGAAIYAKGISNTGLLATTTNGSKNAVKATGGNGAAAIYGNAVQKGVEGVGYRGVYGHTDDSFFAIGVHGDGGIGQDNVGVYGEVTHATGQGVYGFNDVDSSSAIGVYGKGTGAATGVWGTSTGAGVGVYGTAASGYGVYATNTTGGSTAFRCERNAHVQGNLNVVGTLTKGGGTFKIDHPLDPANKFLYHSFVESPDMKNVYDGVVTLDASGEAVVSLPTYFDALNRDVRYQLTAIGGAAPNLHVKSKANRNRFSIAGGSAGQEVSWQVTGIRQDAYAKAHRIEVEVTKKGAEKGRYLHPKENGVAAAKGIDRLVSVPSGR